MFYGLYVSYVCIVFGGPGLARAPSFSVQFEMRRPLSLASQINDASLCLHSLNSSKYLINIVITNGAPFRLVRHRRPELKAVATSRFFFSQFAAASGDYHSPEVFGSDRLQ